MKKCVILIFILLCLSGLLQAVPKGILIEVEDPAGINPNASYITFNAWIENPEGIQESITLDQTANLEPWGYPTAEKYLYIDVGNFENITPGVNYYVWQTNDIFHIEVTFNDGVETFFETKEYVLADSDPVSYLIANGDGIQLGNIEEEPYSWDGKNHDPVTKTFDYIGTGRSDEINVIVDPDVNITGSIVITQYDRPAHNIPDNSLAVPFGIKIEDKDYTYASETFSVKFAWSDDVHNSSEFNHPILVYSSDNGNLWTEFTSVAWALDGTGSYDNELSISITDFTPGWASTTEEPAPSLWAIGDSTMFNLARISSLSSNISVETSNYTDGGETYNYSVSWSENTNASYYRYQYCSDPLGSYDYTENTTNISNEEYEFTFAESEQVRFIKIQGYNGVDNISSLSNETMVIRRYKTPLSSTVSNFSFSFINQSGTITPSQIENLIGDCNVIAQWSDSNQAWDYIGKMPSAQGDWENESYSFDKSKPFMLNSTNGLENIFLVQNIDMSSYVSPSYTINVDTDIQYSMITVPYDTAHSNASELISDIWSDGSAASLTSMQVNKFDFQTQVWNVYTYDGSSGSGDNFTIYPGDIIKVGAVGTSDFNWQE